MSTFLNTHLPAHLLPLRHLPHAIIPIKPINKPFPPRRADVHTPLHVNKITPRRHSFTTHYNVQVHTSYTCTQFTPNASSPPASGQRRDSREIGTSSYLWFCLKHMRWYMYDARLFVCCGWAARVTDGRPWDHVRPDSLQRTQNNDMPKEANLQRHQSSRICDLALTTAGGVWRVSS